MQGNAPESPLRDIATILIKGERLTTRDGQRCNETLDPLQAGYTCLGPDLNACDQR